MSGTPDWFRQIADALQAIEEHPYGPPVKADEKQLAGDACKLLCAGNADKARSLWKLLVQDLGGYMPRAAAVALIRASRTEHLVPDAQAPEVQ